LHVRKPNLLGSTANNYVNLTRLSGLAVNEFMVNDFFVRESNGGDWETTAYVRGISVDVSFLVPNTSLRSWIKQNPSANSVQFGSGSSTYLTVNPTGVGIGTTSPSSKLTLDAGDLKLQSLKSTNSIIQSIIFTNTNSSGFDVANIKGITGANIYEGVLAFDTKDSGGTMNERMRILANGNVGIGTSAPSNKLESVDSSATTFNGIGIYNTLPYGGANILDKAESRLNLGKIEGTARQPMGAIGASPTNNGDSSSGYMSFYTRLSQAMTERMRITNNGNVGIGTVNPSTILNIRSATAQEAFLRLQSTDASGSGRKASVLFNLGGTDRGLVGFVDATANNFEVGNLFTDGNTSILAGNAERMRITSAGNVGIGTTSPDVFSRFHDRILGISTSSGNSFIGINGASGSNGGVEMGAGGTRTGIISSNATTMELGSVTNIPLSMVTNGSTRMTITGDGNVGIGTTTPGHKLTLPHSSNIAWEYGTGDAFEYTTIGKGDGGVPLAFKTTWTGSPTNKIYAFYGLNPSSVETELLTILNGGNVGIGVTNPQQQLDITGNISLGSWTKSGSTYIGLRRNDTGIFGTNGDSGLVIESYNHAAPNNGNFSQRVHLRSHIFDGGSFNALTAYGQNIGIGTDTPLNKLDVRITGADSNDGIIISRTDATTTTNEILGGIGFDSTDGNVPSSILEASAYIAAFAAEDHSVGDKGGYLTFGTAPIDQDDDTVSIERMRITSSGAVGIGTTTTPHLLTVNGNVGANGFYASERITFGDIVGYDTPYIGWNGSSTPYQLRIADPAYEDPIIIDTENVSITANKFIANSSISVGLSLQGTSTVTTTATTQTVLATYAVATYATGKFMIQATTGVNRHISELLVTHNGTVSTATEYAILKTAGNLFTVTTDISGGNVRILVTSASATSTDYKTTFTLIGV
jgi:hypothetical protein